MKRHQCHHGFPLRLGSGQTISCAICTEPGRTRMRRRNTWLREEQDKERQSHGARQAR